MGPEKYRQVGKYGYDIYELSSDCFAETRRVKSKESDVLRPEQSAKEKFDKLLEEYDAVLVRSGGTYIQWLCTLDCKYDVLETFVKEHPEFADRLPKKHSVS